MSEDQRKKARCRSYTRTLIARGVLIPDPCETCGAEKVHAHHPDYSNPRLVVWLCAEHHYQLHREQEGLL